MADRLGLQYHLDDREKKIFALLPGGGALKLTPSTEAEPNPGFHQLGAFKNRSASLADFAGFLSTFTGSQVVDKTGIAGRYRFDVDWRAEARRSLGLQSEHRLCRSATVWPEIGICEGCPEDFGSGPREQGADSELSVARTPSPPRRDSSRRLPPCAEGTRSR